MAARAESQPVRVDVGRSDSFRSGLCQHGIVTDLYELLGVAPNASNEDLRRAYRKNAIVRHRAGAIALGDELTRMRDAFVVLLDPERRRAYDRALEIAARRDRDGRSAEAQLLLAHVRETAEHSARLSREATAHTDAMLRALEAREVLRSDARKRLAHRRRLVVIGALVTSAFVIALVLLLAR